MNGSLANSVNGIASPRIGNGALGRGRNRASQVVIQRNPCYERMRIGTWNVRTMNKPEKLENIKHEMKRLNIDIMGLSEVRWKESGDYTDGDTRVIYSGGERAEKGVAILVRGKIRRTLERYECISDRIMWLKLKGEKVNTTIIQVYMPTSEHPDEEIDEMYDTIEEILENEATRDNVIIMGDWNSVVGEGLDGKEVGQFGLGRRNERGEKLVEFCRRKKLMITNTWFQNHKRRRYTWKMPGDLGRFQIDYILVKQRYRNAVKNSKAYPGADVDSDHNLVMIEDEVRLKTIKKTKIRKKWNTGKFKEEQQNTYASKVNEKILMQRNMGNVPSTTAERWNRLKDSMKKSGEECIGYVKQKAKKAWVTPGMIEKMDERRKWKNKRTEEGNRMYRKLNNQLRRETDRAREQWLEEQCTEMEELERIGRHDLLYEKGKQICEDKRTSWKVQEIEGKNGQKLTRPEDIRSRFIEYVEELYDKQNKPDVELEEETDIEDDFLGPCLLDSEIERAMKDLKNGKSPGQDEIPAEFLKNLDGEARIEIKEIIKELYIEGEWPSDFINVIMVTLRKKNKPTKCSQYRTISLVSHASKIILRVLTRRLTNRAEQFIGNDQFGFRAGCGTRDAIGIMRIISEKMIENDQEMFVCFVDFEKAFDRVQWRKLFDILKAIGVDWRDRRLIRNLYMKQEVRVRVADGESDPGEVGRGVRQGCSLSPVLFNIYAEAMMNEALSDLEEGVRVGGRLIKSVRFADDKAIVCDREEGLQEMINNLNRVAGEYGMKINESKTKVMRIAKRQGAPVRTTIEGRNLEEVDNFKYLGSLLTNDGRCSKEIRTRIAMGKAAFEKEKRLLTGNLNRTLKKRLVKSLIWSVALYGAETWTIKTADKRKLESFEMWIWRRMLKIGWRDHRRNEDVLQEVDEERKLMNVIKERQKNWIGHVLRGESLLKEVIEGRYQGTRARGRRRKAMLDDLKGNRSYGELKMIAQDRENWRRS